MLVVRLTFIKAQLMSKPLTASSLYTYTKVIVSRNIAVINGCLNCIDCRSSERDRSILHGIIGLKPSS